jgi:uncharacterized protein YigE (DUF2233 family)
LGTALKEKKTLPSPAGGRGKTALCAFAVLLAACDGPKPDAAPDQVPDAPAASPVSPACESRSFEGSAFTVCRFDSRRDELRLAWRGPDGAPLRSLAALERSLGTDSLRVRFAINGGMYDEEGAPVGLYVESGRKRKRLNLRSGPGNFHLMPNGVFAVDGKSRVSVTPSREFAAKGRLPRWATQSGPMLVIHGKLHPRFDRDGASRLVRNGVGVKDAATAYFAISEEGVSFGRFARFFRDRLGCADALFLDGSVSSLGPGRGPAGRLFRPRPDGDGASPVETAGRHPELGPRSPAKRHPGLDPGATFFGRSH